jgi:phenylalanyl-tRNA synthetase beta subunit
MSLSKKKNIKKVIKRAKGHEGFEFELIDLYTGQNLSHQRKSTFSFPLTVGL